MSSRPKIPPSLEATILVKSARRCCVCYGIASDLDVKRGQIAHLDHDSLNNREENLAFLCFDHHDQYDSTTRQSKNLTLQEVITYRDRLYIALQERGNHEEQARLVVAGILESDDQALDVVERYSKAAHACSASISAEAIARLKKVVDYYCAMESFYASHETGLSDEQIEKAVQFEAQRLQEAIQLPDGVYGLYPAGEIDRDWAEEVTPLIEVWAAGMASYNECSSLFWELDERYDFDYTYILYGVPLETLNAIGRRFLNAFIYEFGMRNFEDE